MSIIMALVTSCLPPLQATFFFLLTLTLTLALTLAFLLTRPRPVLLLDYSCYKPPFDHKLPFEAGLYFLRRFGRHSPAAISFLRGIDLKSGLGDETYAPSFFFSSDHTPTLLSALHEAREGILSAVDALLSKTHLPLPSIDILIVTSGGFTPSPSLTALICNHYRLNPNIKTYSLSGMGCSSGVCAVDLAARLLSSSRRIQTALVVVNESISLGWYCGEDRSMLVTNCIFRVGTAAAIITNNPRLRKSAKMELTKSLRTHHGQDDASYKAAFQEEDSAGNLGVSLTKDLIRVAGAGLGAHVKELAPKVLPWRELVLYVYRMVRNRIAGGGKKKVPPPDFTTAFEHMCVHTGGKAVIEALGRMMRLPEAVTEPARMCLHRFGNTSSSLVFYELAYFEAKGRVRAGDRVWMVAFGTGFKVNSLVWKAIRDLGLEEDNPWADCIHRYPVKVR